MRCSVIGVASVVRQHPGGGQCRHLYGERDHGLPVVIEVVWIALPVPIDVRPVRVSGVGPKVVRLGEIIVRPARAS